MFLIQNMHYKSFHFLICDALAAADSKNRLTGNQMQCFGVGISISIWTQNTRKSNGN